MTKEHHTTNGLYNHNASNGDTSHTVEQALKYPVVKATCDLITQNKYTGFVVTRAALTLNTFASYAQPVTTKFQDQIRAADMFVGDQVGHAGEIIPLLNTPTDEIVGYATSAVAVVDRSVGEPVRRTAASAYEKALAADAKLLSPVASAYATTIDAYMPAVESESEPEDPVDNATQTFRLLMLSLRAQRRLSRRFKARLSDTAEYTEKQIKHLQESNALLQQTTHTVTQLNQRLLELVLFAKENAIHLKDKVQSPDDVRAAITERLQSVLTQTEVIGKYVRENTGKLPDYVQERLNPMFDYFNNSYSGVISAIQQQDTDVVTKAHNIYKLTAEQTLPILQSAKGELTKTLSFVSVSVNNTAESAKAYVTPMARSLGVTN